MSELGAWVSEDPLLSLLPPGLLPLRARGEQVSQAGGLHSSADPPGVPVLVSCSRVFSWGYELIPRLGLLSGASSAGGWPVPVVARASVHLHGLCTVT